MTALRDRLAAGDLDALDDPLLPLEMVESPDEYAQELLWLADDLTVSVVRVLADASGAAVEIYWSEMKAARAGASDDLLARTHVELRLGQRLRALGPVGCERELRALATLERLCGLGGEA